MGTQRTPDSMISIKVLFDPETFRSIEARAKAAGTSFAEQVRTLTEWGIESEGKA